MNSLRGSSGKTRRSLHHKFQTDMLTHTLIAIAMQLICALLTSDFWLGAAIGAAFYIGRELAQAEYRIIYTHYGRKRANAPWWCGFDPRAWHVKGLLDWMAPTVAAVVVAYAVPQIQTNVAAAL